MGFRAFKIAALSATALASPALAQTIPVPPTRELIDGNGVDLFRGNFTVDEAVASIGGEQGVRLRRVNRGASYFSSNVDAYIQSSGTLFYVTLNGRTDRFTKSGSTWTPTEANGSSLTFASNIYTYTARDGSVATFNKSLIETYNQYGNEGLVTAIVEPDGSRLDITYERRTYCQYYEGDFCSGGFAWAKRLTSAKSAYGYMVKYDYVSDELIDGSSLGAWTAVADRKLVNLAVDYCSTGTFGTNCTLTQSWPGEASPNHVVNTYVTTAGRITGVRRPGSASNDLTIAYDGSGRVQSVADHSGATTYAYADASGSRTVTVTDALNQVSLYTFLITSERLTSYRDPLNNTTGYTYDGNGRLTRITRPEGNYTNFTYDARGNVTLTRHVGKAGSGTPDIVTSAAFPSTCSNPKTCNSPTTTTDARGNVTDYTYNTTHGGVLTVTAPAAPSGIRPRQTFAYTSQQAQIKTSTGTFAGTGTNITLPQTVSQCATLASCAGGADEIRSTVTYGANGVANNLQPTQVASGNGSGTLIATTKLAYDIVGNLVSVDGPLAGTDDTTTAIYDNKRQVIGTISPDPDGAGGRPRLAQRQTFAVNGDLTRTEIGTTTGTTLADLNSMTVAQGVDMVYDADGRKTKDTLTGGGSSHAVTQYSYDAEGRMTCAAVRMNPAAWGSLPASACLAGTQGTHGPDRITRQLRDANGRVTQVQAAVGVAGQEANERTLAYSANGVLAHLIDANNNRTTYEVDGHDRLVKTRFPLPAIGSNSSSTTDYEQLTLDANGNVTARRLRDGQSIGQTFDALNRLTAKNLPGAEWDETFGYDNLGRMTSAAKGPIPHSFTWDALSRQTVEGQIYGQVNRQFDLAGRLTRLTWQDGFYVDYQRDVLGGLLAVNENGVAPLATFAYDNLGRRTALSRGNNTHTSYAYDPASRLSAQTHDLAGTANDLTQTFAYNPASQITQVTRSNDAYAWTGHVNQTTATTPDGLNRIASIAGATPAYDGRGNLTHDPTTGRSYGYWSENELVAASGGYGFGHDTFSRIIDTLTNGVVTKQFVYDGPEIVAVFNPGAGIAERYVRGDGPDEIIAWYEGAGTATRRFAHQDERGSVIAVSDGAGNALAINRYDEFGQPQSTNQGRFQYTGQMWLPEVGLYHYKARVLDPAKGVFMQTDPLGYDGDGPNLYAYVLNDPVNWVDPLGLCGANQYLVILWGSRRDERHSDGAGITVTAPYHYCQDIPYSGPPSLAPGGNALIGKIGAPTPTPRRKKLSQCIVSFMNQAYLGVDWSSIELSSTAPLPGASATNWGSTINVGVLFDNFEADKTLLFHELAHTPQWLSGDLSRLGYAAASLTEFGRNLLGVARGERMRSQSDMHGSLPVELDANAIRDVLVEAYDVAGRPCD